MHSRFLGGLLWKATCSKRCTTACSDTSQCHHLSVLSEIRSLCLHSLSVVAHLSGSRSSSAQRLTLNGTRAYPFLHTRGMLFLSTSFCQARTGICDRLRMHPIFDDIERSWSTCASLGGWSDTWPRGYPPAASLSDTHCIKHRYRTSSATQCASL